MSAYVVSPDTVRLLVAVTDRYGLHDALRDAYPHKFAHDAVGEDRTDDEMRGWLMRYVLHVNARAVLYRYPQDTVDTMPGALMEWRWDTDYRPLPVVEYEPVPFRVTDTDGSGSMPERVASRVLGAAHCLAYQCCELPEWESTPAFRWLQRVHWRAAGVFSRGWDVDDVREVVAA